MAIPDFNDVYEEAESYELDGYALAEKAERDQADDDEVTVFQPMDAVETTMQSVLIDIHRVLARLHGYRLTFPLTVASREHHSVAEQLEVLRYPGHQDDVFVNVCRNVARAAMTAALDASGAFAQYDDSLQAESAKNVLIHTYADKLLERHNLIQP